MKSLDPRVNRLPEIGSGEITPKALLDQFGTFEVFVEPKTGKPFQHEGSIHAPNLEMAYVLAKETFTRRFTCSSLCVVDTRHVYVSPMSEGDQNAYDLFKMKKADYELWKEQKEKNDKDGWHLWLPTDILAYLRSQGQSPWRSPPS